MEMSVEEGALQVLEQQIDEARTKVSVSDPASSSDISEHDSKFQQAASSSYVDQSLHMPVEEFKRRVILVLTELQGKGTELAGKADINMQEAENKILEAEKKMEEAENKMQEAENKMQEAENKTQEAEKKMEEAENEMEEAENKMERADDTKEEALREMYHADRMMSLASAQIFAANEMTAKADKQVEDANKRADDAAQRANGAEDQMLIAQAQAKAAEQQLRSMTMQRSRECEEEAKKRAALVDKSKELHTIIETLKNTVKEKNSVIQQKDGQTEALKNKVEELQSLIDIYETGQAINGDTPFSELHKERETRKIAEQKAQKLAEQLEQHKIALAQARKNELDRRDTDVYNAGILNYEQQYHQASLRLENMNTHIKVLEARIAEVQAKREEKRKAKLEREPDTPNDQPAEASSASVVDETPKSAAEVEGWPAKPNRAVAPSYNAAFPPFAQVGAAHGKPKNQKGSAIPKIVKWPGTSLQGGDTF